MQYFGHDAVHHHECQQGIGNHDEHYMDTEQRRLQYRHQMCDRRVTFTEHRNQKRQAADKISETEQQPEFMLENEGDDYTEEGHELHGLISVGEGNMAADVSS